MITRSIVFAASVALAGCASAPATDATGRRLTVADAGPPPDAPLKVIQALVLPELKDPDSAVIKVIGKPRARVLNSVALVTDGGAGWGICAQYNAKNSYGGFVGYKSVFVLWGRGAVIDVFRDGLADQFCAAEFAAG